MSADLESNLDDVMAHLQSLVDGVNFERPGSEGSLGRDLAGLVADDISRRTARLQHAADGSPLKANEDKYRKYKERRYHSYQPLIRTGQMTSLESLLGEVTITHDEVTMKYGTGEPPSRTSTGAPLSKGDAAITDREKAKYVSDERPFYEFDDRIRKHAGAYAGRWLKDNLGG